VEEIRLGRGAPRTSGKVGIPESILNKKRPASILEEWETMKSHVEVWRHRFLDPLTPLARIRRNGSSPPRILRRLGLSRSTDGGKKSRWGPASSQLPTPTITITQRSYLQEGSHCDGRRSLSCERCANGAVWTEPSCNFSSATMRAMAQTPIIEVGCNHRPGARQLNPPLFPFPLDRQQSNPIT